MKNSLSFILLMLIGLTSFAKNKEVVKNEPKAAPVKAILAIYDCYDSNGKGSQYDITKLETRSDFCKRMGLSAVNPVMRGAEASGVDIKKCQLISGKTEEVEVGKQVATITNIEFSCENVDGGATRKFACKGNRTTDLSGCLKNPFSMEEFKADLEAKKAAAAATKASAASAKTSAPAPTKAPVEEVK